jgi:hypothetical protein
VHQKVAFARISGRLDAARVNGLRGDAKCAAMLAAGHAPLRFERTRLGRPTKIALWLAKGEVDVGGSEIVKPSFAVSVPSSMTCAGYGVRPR